MSDENVYTLIHENLKTLAQKLFQIAFLGVEMAALHSA